MKIVTTWHRGSVATEDEIRKKRHNKRRLFSYSLILLFSALCGAQGARLCQKTLTYVANSPFCERDESYGCHWAVGEDCGNDFQVRSMTPEDKCRVIWFKGVGFHTNIPCAQGDISANPPPLSAGGGDNYWHWCKPDGKTEYVCISSASPGTLHIQNGATQCAGMGRYYYHLFYMMN